MNDIYEHFNDDEKMLLVQAPTGMGKTLGYLVPGAYQAQRRSFNRGFNVDDGFAGSDRQGIRAAA